MTTPDKARKPTAAEAAEAADRAAYLEEFRAASPPLTERQRDIIGRLFRPVAQEMHDERLRQDRQRDDDQS